MRLIDADELKKAVKYIPWCEWPPVLDCIDEQETVDAEPVVHAHWEEVNYYSHCGMCCSRCRSRISYKEYYNGNHLYCHKCGAKMDEEDI